MVVDVVRDKPFERRMIEVQALDVRALGLTGLDVDQVEDVGREHAGATDVRTNDPVRSVELVDELLREALDDDRHVRQTPVARLERHRERVGVVAASAIRVAFGAVTNKPCFCADTVDLVVANLRGARRK